MLSPIYFSCYKIIAKLGLGSPDTRAAGFLVLLLAAFLLVVCNIFKYNSYIIIFVQLNQTPIPLILAYIYGDYYYDTRNNGMRIVASYEKKSKYIQYSCHFLTLLLMLFIIKGMYNIRN